MAPNRASWQGSLGGDGWAALAEWPGRLLLTPRALRAPGREERARAGEARVPTRRAEPALALAVDPERDHAPQQLPDRGAGWSPADGELAGAGRSTSPTCSRAAWRRRSSCSSPFPLEAIASLAGRGGRMVVRARSRLRRACRRPRRRARRARRRGRSAVGRARSREGPSGRAPARARSPTSREAAGESAAIAISDGFVAAASSASERSHAGTAGSSANRAAVAPGPRSPRSGGIRPAPGPSAGRRPAR